MNSKNRKISEKAWGIFWMLAYLCSLAPIFILAGYNFPCADDYGYSIYTRLAWVDTHSLLAVLAAAGRKVAESWFSWQGTYSSIFMMALQPGIFGDGFYALTPWVILAPFSLAVLYLFRTVFEKLLGTEKWVSVSAACIYLLIAVQTMVDKTQGIFWYNGSVHYMLPQAALFALTGIVLRMAAEPEMRRKRRLAAAVLLSVYIGGGNLVTGLECGIWLAIAIVVAFMSKRKRTAKGYTILFAVWILCFAVNAGAPGNWVRQDGFVDRPGAVKAVFESFYYCLDFVFGKWGDWTVFALILLIFPFVAKAVQGSRRSFCFPCPLLVLALSFCILSSMFTPSVYAAGEPGAGRIFNIIYLTFLLLVIVNMAYLYGWFVQKCDVGKAVGEKEDGIYRIAVLAGIAFCAALVVAAEPDRFTSVSAAKSVVSGEAGEWKREEKMRLELLLDDSVREAELEEFTVKPKLLFYEDIEPDPDNWKNIRMSGYFRKESVRLVPAEQ